MFPSNAVSRVKLKRDLFKVENKLEPNKRRWAGPKTVSGLNSSAERVAHVQDQDSLPENAIDVKTTEEISCAPEPSGIGFHGQVGSSSFTGHKRDASEHDGGQTVNNKGILPSRVSVVSNGRITRSQGPRTRSQSASKHGKASRQFAEHKQEICYRVRLALCFGGKKQNGGKRAKNRQAKARGRALSYINSDVSVKSSNISIKSTVRAKHGAGSVEKTPEIHLNPKYAQSTGLRIVGPDTLGSEKPRPRRGRPRQIFVHSFGESKAQVKTTIKTEVRRAQTPQSLKSKTRRARSGRPVVPGTDISSKVELRRCLRSGTRLSSRKDLKRLVKNSCCALCGDIKYSPVRSKNQARLHKHKSRPVRTSQTAWREGAIDVLKSPQPPTTPIFLFEKYPLVRLCDVAQVFDIASRDFSCVLPAALRRKGKCKRVRCLMKDFRFLMHPQLLDVKKHRSKIAKQCWEVSTPTNSCASFSSGDHSQGTSDSKCIYVTEKTQDGCVKDWDGYLARNPGCKRMRNNDNEGTPSVLPQCAQAPEKACLIQNSSERCEDTSSPVHRVPPIILRRVTASSSFAVQGEDEGENSGVSLDEDGEEMSTNEDSESKMNSPESFSCQRTKAYIFFRPASCARTYKSWPFPRWGPPIELKSLLRTGPRWIVTTLSAETTKHVTQDSLGKSPECLLDNKVQNKHFRPLEQSRLASLEHTSQDLVEGLNGSKNLMSQDIHMLKLTEHIGCSAATRESLRVQVLLSEKCHKKPIVMLESLERTEGVEEHLNIPGSMLNHDHKISKPAELKSNQSEKEAFGDSHNVTEFSAFAMTDQNANWKPIHLCHAASLEESSHKSQLLKNHSLFNTPNQKSLSPGSKNQHMSVIRRDDKKTLVKTSETRCALNPEFTQISKPPLSRASSDMSLDSQGETESDIGLLSFYNPESLSELCLKSGLLKAQHSSSMAICSTREQDASDVVSGTQNAVAPTLKNDPSSAGESKQKRLLDFTNTESSSSSEDENDRGSESSDKDSAEQDESEDLRSDDVMCQINEKGSAPPHSSESNVLANSFLDVCRAYEEDALVLDVIQDDPELFGAVETVKKQAMLTKENKTMHVKTKGQTRNHCKIVWDLKENSRTPVLTGAAIKKEEVEASGSLTVQDTPSYKAQLAHGINCQQVTPFINSESATDSNNNPEMNTDSVNYITVINTGAARLVLDSFNNERLSTVKETSALRTSSNYCWYYFSEHHTCLRSACWFQHTLRDGDEELCMETVKKFCHVGNHAIVLRAVEVFVGYYNSNAPGVSFSQETVNSLLLYLLNLVLLKEFVMVVNLLLKYKRLPPPEIVLALFKHVTERGLIGSIPEIIVLTSKIVEAGCVFSVDQCEVMQSHLQMMQVPREQMDIFLAVKCRALATNPHTAGLSDLAQAVVRVEMLKHQEDWTGLGQVFCGVCVGSHSPSEFTRFCCCVTMALLKEPKDKLSLPYEQFAESVCQQVSADSMVKNILGRIGVSLIFRYHRTREWNKGVKLVNVMFRLHIEFTTLKGLMGNEHRVSRCHLVTTATELFLHSGSIEGALKLLRADDWFVSSDIWPCEQTDIETRRHVLTLLAGKTSHRDTFDILTNLPGLKQPINGVQVDEYTEMFNAHLRLCVMKQTLPVAADILEFMLMQGMVPESIQLQNLIHKLGKQNNWSRARGLFKRARSAGFYAAVVCEKDSLFLPCSLTEIEMTLAFEMFITSIKTSLQPPAGSSQPLLITLRRRTDVEDVTESVYLAAGCRLLSAALIPNPKLNIRYTAVNQNQEQLFQLDRGSAHKWLLQNKRWAQEIWAS